MTALVPKKGQRTRMKRGRLLVVSVALLTLFAGVSAVAAATAPKTDEAELAEHLLAKASIRKGICAVLGSADGKLALAIVRASDFLVDVREPRADRVRRATTVADVDGLWVKRIIVERGPLTPLPWATDSIDLLIAAELSSADFAKLNPAEVMRVLRPKGKAILGCGRGVADAVTARELKGRLGKLKVTVTEDAFGVWAEVIKSVPEGIDSWSHWEKGPDNNPVSNDQVIKPPYMLQWLAKPYYVAMPAVTTAAAGRTFVALGNITHHRREWPTLLTLTARSGYNGRVLWKRDLPDGYMVHRSAFVATDDVFYMIDGDRALMLDAETGREIGEIRIPGSNGEWKWMALVGRRLFVLSGKPYKVETVRSRNTGSGWWWTGMSPGYKAERLPWIWGSTVTAIDVDTKQVMWTHKEDEPIDARGMVMGGGSIFFYAPDSRFACLDAATGGLKWESTEANVLELITEPGEGLQGHQGFRSDCISLYTPQAVIFEVTNRMNVIALATRDGKLLWHRKKSTQRPNQIYVDGKVIGALGPWGNHLAVDPLSGEELEDLRFMKYGCVRLTANPNAFFTRGEGVLRYDREEKRIDRLTAIRPGCNAGVITANGMLYVGPWFCDCNLSLIGMAALCSEEKSQAAGRTDQPERESDDLRNVEPLEVTSRDWPTYRANNDRSASSPAHVPASIEKLWYYKTEFPVESSPPTSAGGLVFIAGEDGKVRAIDAATGKERWNARTAGPVRFPPTVWEGRAYVGSADGRIHVFEAATGRRLWRFRASRVERKIMIYGALCSTWPVNSGVLVEDGVAYAAGGIADFSGTYVCALDAITGMMRWRNDKSGNLQGALRNGVSVQGDMTVASGKLLLAGGNQVSPATFDLETGELLGPTELPPKPRANRGQEVAVFRDHYLIFGGKLMYSSPGRVVNRAYCSIRRGDEERRLTSGRIVPAWSDRGFVFVHARQGLTCCDADQIEGLFEEGFPTPTGKQPSPQQFLIDTLPEERRRWNIPAKTFSGTIALALAANAVIAVDEIPSPESPTRWVLSAYDLEDGNRLWEQELPDRALRDGLLVDRDGRVVVALRDGGLVCYGGR